MWNASKSCCSIDVSLILSVRVCVRAKFNIKSNSAAAYGLIELVLPYLLKFLSDEYDDTCSAVFPFLNDLLGLVNIATLTLLLSVGFFILGLFGVSITFISSPSHYFRKQVWQSLSFYFILIVEETKKSRQNFDAAPARFFAFTFGSNSCQDAIWWRSRLGIRRGGGRGGGAIHRAPKGG